MTDARTLDDLEEDERDDRRCSDGRGLWNVLAIAALVVIVILALLMLRGCDGIMNSANHASTTNQIVPVAGSNPVPGKVSIWLAPGGRIAQVLASAKLSGTVVDMGDGRFVVDVPTGSEVESVRRLRDDKSVYDAGRVYDGTGK